MEQINFRLKAEDKQILQQISKLQGISVAEYIKRLVLNDLSQTKVEAAFDLFRKGKIGRKRAFLLSGLTYNEFTLELHDRKIQEHTSEDAFERGIETIDILDLTPLLRRKLSESD
jgi:predicted HTH domain antitoxin